MTEDDNQIIVPPSFIAVYSDARQRLSEPAAVVRQRYELCEDMAQMLTDTARTMEFSLGITEADVLQRVGQGLRGEGAVVSPDEATWVVTRLAELLDWSAPR